MRTAGTQPRCRVNRGTLLAANTLRYVLQQRRRLDLL